MWVLGGICQETREVFVSLCHDRSRATLEKLILQHVAIGSKVITDGWKAYAHLGMLFIITIVKNL